MIANTILHGGDYNPDQWLQYPEVLEDDIRLMKEANMNCVSLGIFAWASLEPEEGIYRFEWLEKIVDRLGEEGIMVVMATPTGGMPQWLMAKYPEVMMTAEDGHRNLPGIRHNFCYTSPVMREKTFAIDTELSRTFGEKKNVVLWHISNEYGGNKDGGSCHCELCQEAFRGWLRKKYGTLDRLNHAWWTSFWSHTYTDWSQIHSPAPNGELSCHALKLDWRRFSTDQITDFCAEEIRAVRTYSDLPVTTNFMYFFKPYDYFKMQAPLDVISWDNYPYWHKSRDEVPQAVKAAACHNIMRSLRKQPFLMMESTPSTVNWRPVNPLMRPGMQMLGAMQAISLGADSVQYFQFRKGRGSSEKFHGAVVDHKNAGKNRTFKEISQTGARLANLTELLQGTVNRPKAAIIFDWNNWWAYEDVQGGTKEWKYPDEIRKHYCVFWEAGIDVDFVSMEDDLENYRLVAAPLNYLYSDGYAQRVREFVRRGGTYMTTAFSGIVDDTDLCFTGSHPLKDVLGIEQMEIDAPTEEFTNSVVYCGNEYPLGRIRELIELSDEKTEILGVYEEDYVKGTPVVTRHVFGEGCSYYLAAEMPPELLNALYAEVFDRLGLANQLDVTLPYGVTSALRESEDGSRKLVFVLNFLHEPVTVSGIGRRDLVDAETGESVDAELRMEALSCRILRTLQDGV